MINKYKWDGYFVFRVNGKVQKIIKNTISSLAIIELAKPLIGTSPDLEIKYLAVGTDATAPTTADTTLGTESFRCLYEARTNPSTGRHEHTFTIDTTEAVVHIKELGIFGGAGATASADSGTLISRVLLDWDKQNDEELAFTRIDIVGRG